MAETEKYIWLARHGQTHHNAATGESQVDGDVLTEYGWEQGRALGQHLTDEGVTSIVCSPLERARQTAEAVNETLGVEITVDDTIYEIIPPSGQPDSEEDQALAEHWSRYMVEHAANPDFKFYGAESFNEVKERVRGFVDALAEMPGTLVISHAGFIRFAMGYMVTRGEFQPARLESLWVYEVANAGVSRFRYAPERPGYRKSTGWSVVTWNFVGHIPDEKSFRA